MTTGRGIGPRKEGYIWDSWVLFLSVWLYDAYAGYNNLFVSFIGVTSNSFTDTTDMAQKTFAFTWV